MWSERFVIIVQSLQEEYLPSKWHAYHPTIVDVSILAGTMGFFLLCSCFSYGLCLLLPSPR